MSNTEGFTQKWNGFKKKDGPKVQENLSPWAKIKKVIGLIVTWIYRLRGVLLAIPVVYAAVKLASYNMEHLPQIVGINLQASGAFADTITREFAVYGPLGVTAACLVLMLCSRKVMYPWAISVFTLVIPIILLLSNRYPC